MTGNPSACVRACAMFALLAAVLVPTPAAAAGRTVAFPSLDGVMLAAQLYESRDRPAPAVVLVHMLSRSRADWDLLAGYLGQAGITALAIDLRGHGASAGTATLSEMSQDVRAAVQWLSAQPDVRPDAVAVVGASLGANLALLAAAEQPTVRVVAAVSPSLDYRGVRVSPDLMRRLGDRPVWLAASTEDPYALRTIQDLASGAGGAREQRLTAVTGHGSALLAADPDLAAALVDWLRQRLLS